MPLSAAPTLVKQRFRFVVEVSTASIFSSDGQGPLVDARFRICTELSAEIQKRVIRHGGSPLPFKYPGDVTFNDVTLEHGATDNGELWGWFATTLRAAGSLGAQNVSDTGSPFKRNVTIVEQDRDGSTLNRWYLAGAWPVKFVAGEWDNESDEFTISAVTLTYDYFAASALKGGPDNTEMQGLASRL